MKKVITLITILAMIAVMVIPAFASVTINYGSPFGGWFSSETEGVYTYNSFTQGSIYYGFGDVEITNNGSSIYTSHQFVIPDALGSFSDDILISSPTPYWGDTLYYPQMGNQSFPYNVEASNSWDVLSGCSRLEYILGDTQTIVFKGTTINRYYYNENLNTRTALAFTVSPAPSDVTLHITGTFYIIDDVGVDGQEPPIAITRTVDKKVLLADAGNIYINPRDLGVYTDGSAIIDWLFDGIITLTTTEATSIIPIVPYTLIEPTEYILTDGNASVTNGQAISPLGLFVQDFVNAVDNTVNPNGTLDITANGTYNVANYSQVKVSVPTTINAPSMFEWLIDSATALLSFQIAPNFTIGGILTLVVGLSLIMWIIKLFMGG